MIRYLSILLTIVHAQTVLDLITPDTRFPRKLYVIGKGIRRRISDGSIVRSTEWGPLIIVHSVTTTAHYGLSQVGQEPEDRLVILRGQDGSEVEIGNASFYTRRQIPSPMGVIGVEPGSLFTQAFPHFMVRPVISPTSKLVMELMPSNIDNICQLPMSYVDGIISFQDGSETFHRWATHMIPRISTEDNDGTHTQATEVGAHQVSRHGFMFNISYEQLSYDLVIGPIIEHVESRSSARRFENSGMESSDLRFVNCNDLSIFPNIVYSFYNFQNSQFNKQVDIILYPEDYAEIITDSDGTSSCVAHIRSTDGPHESGTIGSNIVRAVNTHFDSINGKIGFCDSTF